MSEDTHHQPAKVISTCRWRESLRSLEQPAASLRVEHVEAKGAEVGEGLIGWPTGVGQCPQCPTTWGQFFLDNWAMQKWLAWQAGGKGG